MYQRWYLEEAGYGLVKRLHSVDLRPASLASVRDRLENWHGRAAERCGGEAVLVVVVAHHLGQGRAGYGTGEGQAWGLDLVC